ncbi:MAG TPA: FdtA/QdtA family cupin domain-containing protein [Candidatus Omnitrophota bacterium]|nr:FdtA/QdtA family cupin domain-containing protein [Candidatus Omnitrophota bacterium]HPS36819.1 FdtA/QdtA family cupin domain-containing protein [Candidatus Omnitrophota bacterium]
MQKDKTAGAVSMSPELINLPRVENPRGNLAIIEEEKHIPFKIERVYWVYDVPGGEAREGYALKEQQELIVALSGSFDVLVSDGKVKRFFTLNRSYQGLFLPASLWRQMRNFSTNSLALVLCSSRYDPEDYIRDYQLFLNYLGHHEK